MTFKHDLLPDVQLEQINDPAGRYYLKDGKRYLSCTNLIGQMLSAFQRESAGLENWKKRVGEREANRVRNVAAAKGTALHKICEDYILNRPLHKRTPPLTKAAFNVLKPHIDQNVEIVYGVEHRAYSDRFLCAGTIDLICKWNGKKTVLDFKTARKVKQKSQIIQYFLQATMYANMLRETHDFNVEQIIILIAVEHEKKPQQFLFKADEYQETLEKLFAKFEVHKIASEN